MAGNHKLGRISVKHPANPVPNLRRQARRGKFSTGVLLLVVFVLLAGLVYGGQVLAAQVRPQRIIFRGCWLTDAEEILAVLGYGTDSSFSQLRRNAASLDDNAIRWLRGIAIEQSFPRTAVLTVEERLPVLGADALGTEYWLCDDGELVSRSPGADVGEYFKAIDGNPAVRINHAVEAGYFENAEPVMIAAACCIEVMPGMISVIEIDADRVMNLYDRNGFRILLGQPESLPEKIGALPKALRLNENERGNMRYLDASNVDTFYEKWKEPIS